MARKKAKAPEAPAALDLFAPQEPVSRRRQSLFIPRLLRDAAENSHLDSDDYDAALSIAKNWAEPSWLASRNETSIDAEFLQELFGSLGYRTVNQSPDDYELERQFTVPGVGKADAAIGRFGRSIAGTPVAVIELKGPHVDLDRDKSNGRTPVQQLWDYLNALPECSWGILSNFRSIRLYHRQKGSLTFDEFRVAEFKSDIRFKQFYYLFERGAFLVSKLKQLPRAESLLKATANRQREVGDELYNAYHANRIRMIEHLVHDHGKSLDRAIHIAQMLLDRIIFIAFCEDRGLLPADCIKSSWTRTPPGFSRVVNPRWRNFLDLFHAIDKGHNAILVEDGYNGGLFKHDPEVDDLQLGDDWTDFFKNVGEYDFKDEVNVDVLGQLFERSIGELERVRRAGLFTTGDSEDKPAMPKSPERKRMGIYYTPPEFTRFIVRETVGQFVEARHAAIRNRMSLKPEDLNAASPTPALADYWKACHADLATIKIVDPACGSGAFLIEAYDQLEAIYRTVVQGIAFHAGLSEETLDDAIPHAILTDNLFGVDLSEQGVEITQLALWIRSADRGKKLADLSKNIVWGNSLVTDSAVHPKAMTWATAFPAVFDRPERGFDLVIGNPPWERLKIQEREFFAISAPAIAGAVNAAQRRRLIAALETNLPELYQHYLAQHEITERTLEYVRSSGDFPLTGKGDVNTYMLFAELARSIVAPNGRVGLLVPSGIATDHTTKEFFAELMESKALSGLYDFENREKVFPDVDGRFKFSVLLFGGSSLKTKQSDFVFFAHSMDDLAEKSRHIELTSKDIALLNPNTRTCPIFRSRRDAELTKAIYQRVPILIDHSRKEGGNPWGIRFMTMFHQTNDAELFHEPADLKKDGYKLNGNRWVKGKSEYLPLYEAKMIQMYDHRAASVVTEAGNWMRQGQTEATTLVSHQNPEFVALPRWWVESSQVDRTRGRGRQPAYLTIKDVTSATNQRTVIASFIPESAVVNSAPMLLNDADLKPKLHCCLLANLNSVPLDFIARQKVGGLHLNFFIVEQFPIFPPDKYAEKCPWAKKQSLEKWISDRVLKLTCTANDMIPLAEATGFEPTVHKWNPGERAELQAELDAAYFHLYGIGREDTEFVLSTFQGLKDDDDEDRMPGIESQTGLILAAFDRLAV